jgi:hypothetical protein
MLESNNRLIASPHLHPVKHPVSVDEQEFDCSVRDCIMLFSVFSFNRASLLPTREREISNFHRLWLPGGTWGGKT